MLCNNEEKYENKTAVGGCMLSLIYAFLMLTVFFIGGFQSHFRAILMFSERKIALSFSFSFHVENICAIRKLSSLHAKKSRKKPEKFKMNMRNMIRMQKAQAKLIKIKNIQSHRKWAKCIDVNSVNASSNFLWV